MSGIGALRVFRWWVLGVCLACRSFAFGGVWCLFEVVVLLKVAGGLVVWVTWPVGGLWFGVGVLQAGRLPVVWFGML